MKNFQKLKNQAKKTRHLRVRAKIKGIQERPRLSVYRSLKHIYAQLIDDTKGITLVSASDSDLTDKKTKIPTPTLTPSTSNDSKDKVIKKGHKTEIAYQVGQLIAQRAQEKKIEKVVFDKAGYKYHGRIKALAEGAREKGLKF